MRNYSATDRAIAEAFHAGTLRIVIRDGRFGEYYSIEDSVGVIEVQMTATECDNRVSAITGEHELVRNAERVKV